MSPYRKPAPVEVDVPSPRVTFKHASRVIAAIIFGETVLVGCIGVGSQDLNALQDAAKLNLAAYKHSDGGAERALERGAYCAVTGVLRRNDAGLPDAGEITCP